MRRSLYMLHKTISHHYRSPFFEVILRAGDMAVSFSMCMHGMFARAGYVESGGVDATVQAISQFTSSLDSTMKSIDADSVRTGSEKAAARQAFHERVMADTIGPLVVLAHAFPHISLREKCAMYTLHLIWRLCMHLRQHDFAKYLQCGGRRPRRGSI